MPVSIGNAAKDFARSVQRAFDVLVPQACVGCRRGVESGHAPVCTLCWHRLPRLAPPWCLRCGATTTATRNSAVSTGLPVGCAECLEWPEALPRAVAPYAMDGCATRVVHGLKYGGWQRLANPMARDMAPAAARIVGQRSPLLVPVPLSAARLRERGFNQAQLLADELGRVARWPVADAIQRLPGGRTQARLGRFERVSNVRERFRLGPDLSRVPEWGGRVDSVILVDDVLTTGATAAACAGALGESGLPCLGVVTFARAVGPFDRRT